jgi:NRPS condensation-like uncharacterized protein
VLIVQNTRLSLNTLEHAVCLMDFGSHSNQNFTVICNYRGPLDTDLLERALVHLADIHLLLGVTLDNSNNTYEFIKAKYAVPITLIKYVGGTQSEDVSWRDLKESFDIEGFPLWKVSLLKGIDEGQLLVTFHHAIADGICGMNLLDTLFHIISDIYNEKEPRKIEFDSYFPPLESLHSLSRQELKPLGDVKATPRIPYKYTTGFVNLHLDERTTSNILAWTKTQGIKVNATLFAALLLAIRNVMNPDFEDFKAHTVVNFRPFFNPPVSNHLMRLLGVAIPTLLSVKLGDNVKEVAKKIHDDVHLQLAQGEHVLQLQRISQYLSTNPSPEDKWRDDLFTGNTVTVTNIGVLEFTGDYKDSPFKIEALTFTANVQTFFENKHNLVLAALCFKDRLNLSLWRLQELVSKSEAQALLLEMERILTKDLA